MALSYNHANQLICNMVHDLIGHSVRGLGLEACVDPIVHVINYHVAPGWRKDDLG